MEPTCCSPSKDKDLVPDVPMIMSVRTTPDNTISVNAERIEVSPASSPYSSSV